MNFNRFRLLVATVCLAGTLITGGCGRSGAPREVAVKDLPTESKGLFDQAAPDVKTLATGALTALEGKDWAAAWAAFQVLSERKDLTAAQREFVASSLVTVGAQMQKAGDAGDAKAESVRQAYRATK